MKTFLVQEYVDGDLKVFVKDNNEWREVGTIPFKDRDLPLAQQVVAIERVLKTELTEDETRQLLQDLAFPRRH